MNACRISVANGTQSVESARISASGELISPNRSAAMYSELAITTPGIICATKNANISALLPGARSCASP